MDSAVYVESILLYNNFGILYIDNAVMRRDMTSYILIGILGIIIVIIAVRLITEGHQSLFNS